MIFKILFEFVFYLEIKISSDVFLLIYEIYRSINRLLIYNILGFIYLNLIISLANVA